MPSIHLLPAIKCTIFNVAYNQTTEIVGPYAAGSDKASYGLEWDPDYRKPAPISFTFQGGTLPVSSNQLSRGLPNPKESKKRFEAMSRIDLEAFARAHSNVQGRRAAAVDPVDWTSQDVEVKKPNGTVSNPAGGWITMPDVDEKEAGPYIWTFDAANYNALGQGLILFTKFTITGFTTVTTGGDNPRTLTVHLEIDVDCGTSIPN